jgi:hypothetical protein
VTREVKLAVKTVIATVQCIESLDLSVINHHSLLR